MARNKPFTDEEVERARALRLGGMSYRQIGLVLGRSKTTVKKYLDKEAQEAEQAEYDRIANQPLSELLIDKARLEERLKNHWNETDLKTEYFLTDTIQKLIEAEEKIYRRAMEQKREKEKKKADKQKGLIISLEPYPEYHEPQK